MSEKLVSNFAFKFNLYHYIKGPELYFLMIKFAGCVPVAGLCTT